MTDINIHKIIAVPEANIDLSSINQGVLLQKENKALKQTLAIGILAGIVVLIYNLKRNEKREEN